MNLGDYLEDRYELVNQAVQHFVQSKYKDELLAMAAVMITGGKRVRGILSVLCCEAMGGKAEQAVDAACAVELAHCASLIKDDLLDEDEERRDNPSFWKLFGFKAGLLAPDVFVPHALGTLLENQGHWCLKVAVDAWWRTARGQMMDLPMPQIDLPLPFRLPGWPERLQISIPMLSPETDYEGIIGLKSAPLFEAACDLGTRAAKMDHKVNLAKHYGFNSGMAFQVHDDYTDLIKALNKPWNEVADPLPVSISALQRLLGSGDTVTQLDCTNTLALGDKYLQLAVAAAEDFPDTEFRPLLAEFPKYCCNALLAEVGVSMSSI